MPDADGAHVAPTSDQAAVKVKLRLRATGLLHFHQEDGSVITRPFEATQDEESDHADHSSQRLQAGMP
jgi:hypothetical protein